MLIVIGQINLCPGEATSAKVTFAGNDHNSPFEQLGPGLCLQRGHTVKPFHPLYNKVQE